MDTINQHRQWLEAQIAQLEVYYKQIEADSHTTDDIEDNVRRARSNNSRRAAFREALEHLNGLG